MPEPKVLEEYYTKVYGNYHRIICAKSGNALFATKDKKAIAQVYTEAHLLELCFVYTFRLLLQPIA